MAASGHLRLPRRILPTFPVGAAPKRRAARVWPWTRPARTRAAGGGARELGVWGARPLDELSPRAGREQSPPPGPLSALPLAVRVSPAPAPVLLPPGWKRG